MFNFPEVLVFQSARQMQKKSIWIAFTGFFLCYLLRQVAACYRKIWNSNAFHRVSVWTALAQCVESDKSFSFHFQPWPLQGQNCVNCFSPHRMCHKVHWIQIKIKNIDCTIQASGIGHCTDGIRLLTNCHCWLKTLNVPGDLSLKKDGFQILVKHISLLPF